VAAPLDSSGPAALAAHIIQMKEALLMKFLLLQGGGDFMVEGSLKKTMKKINKNII